MSGDDAAEFPEGNDAAEFHPSGCSAAAPEGNYRADLAWVHHVGFGSHADACAPGILQLLEPVRERNGLVVELGCGSGGLTRHLVDAGHHVIATDASPAMVELARKYVPEADVRLSRLPDDPIPAADAIVSVGHVLSYLDDQAAVERALRAVAQALLRGGIFAIDLCDLEWGALGAEAPPFVRVADDWAIVTIFSRPAPDRFVRDITTFRKQEGGFWRRSDERHDNVLVDASDLSARLRTTGVDVEVRGAFGAERLPPGLRVLIGRRD